MPVVDFNVPTGICMPGGNASFDNTTTVADNSVLGYQWDFGDGNTSTATDPAHVYSAVGSYNVTLVATSAFGCVDQRVKIVDGFFDKPIATFSVNTTGALPGRSECIY